MATSISTVQNISISRVKISGLVVSKIVMHSREGGLNSVTGRLLGLNDGSILEISDCYRLLESNVSGTTGAEEETVFETDMMRCLQELNVDDNSVGWYQIVVEPYQTVELLETFLRNQVSFKTFVCLVYEAQLSGCGGLPLKAIKVKTTFENLYRSYREANDKSRIERIYRTKNYWSNIFEEVPVEVHNSMLLCSTMYVLRHSTTVTAPNVCKPYFEPIDPIIMTNLETLVEALDDLIQDQRRMIVYFHHAHKQKHLSHYQQRLRMENKTHKANGEELALSQDSTLSKLSPESNQLERLLVNSQVHTLCDQLYAFSVQALQSINF